MLKLLDHTETSAEDPYGTNTQLQPNVGERSLCFKWGVTEGLSLESSFASQQSFKMEGGGSGLFV